MTVTTETRQKAELLTAQFAKMLVKMERLLQQMSTEDAATLLVMLERKLVPTSGLTSGQVGGNFGPTSGQLHHRFSSSAVSNGNYEQRSKNHQQREEAKEVLGFLNEKTGRSFRAVDTNLRLIEARLKSGASVTDCKGVVARKVRAWKTDPKMCVYLRPSTLFSATNFEQYLGEKEAEVDRKGDGN